MDANEAAVPGIVINFNNLVAGPSTSSPNNTHESSTSGIKRKLEVDNEDNTIVKRGNSQQLDLDRTEAAEDTSQFLHERTMLQDHIINNDIPMLTSILAPLTAAIKNNNLEVIQCLLDEITDIDETYSYLNPLIEAAKYKSPDAVSLIFNTLTIHQKPETIAVASFRVLREIFTHIYPQYGCTGRLDVAVDVALVQFDIPHFYKIICDKCCPTRRQLVARMLNPIRQRRNILTYAVEQKSSNFIAYLLSLPALNDVINVPDNSNDTALSLALSYKDLELAQHLLQKGALPNVSRTNTNVLFESLIKTNDIDAIKLLYESNADITTGEDHIPLTQAVKNNNQDLVNYLLDKGANIHGTCWKGYSALTAAIHYSNLPIAEVLINRGADVNLCDASGRSPLNVAIEENKQEFVAYLIETNASISAADACGFTPLTQAVKANRLNLIELLCDKGSDPNEEDKNGHTPLTYAARSNHEEIVLYLINVRQVDVNKQGWIGSTALLNAIDNKNIMLAEALISKGAKVNAGDWKGRKPLVRAVETDNIPMIKLLLESNNNNIEETNIGFMDWFNWMKAKSFSPLSKAVALNKPEIVKLLLQHDSTGNKTKIQALIKAIERENIPLIKLLLKKGGVDAMEFDANGVSPMQKAIEVDSLKLVELLSRHGKIKPADILTEACARNAFNILKHYIKNLKIDVNLIDSQGDTPLTKSVEKANLTMIKYLYGKKADVNKIDGNGFTPLTKALAINNFDAVRAVVNAKADVSLVDGNNVKPLAKAVEIDNLTLIKFLINHDKRSEEPFPATAECPVCYLPLRQSQVYSTICGHMFCMNCINTVCRTTGTCPTCRKAIPMNSVHPLFI